MNLTFQLLKDLYCCYMYTWIFHWSPSSEYDPVCYLSRKSSCWPRPQWYWWGQWCPCSPVKTSYCRPCKHAQCESCVSAFYHSLRKTDTWKVWEFPSKLLPISLYIFKTISYSNIFYHALNIIGLCSTFIFISLYKNSYISIYISIMSTHSKSSP